MTYPTGYTFHRTEELLATMSYVIGGAYLKLGGNHRLGVTRCQRAESERERRR
jgi:hypothetical protein